MTFYDGSGNAISGSGGPVSTERIMVLRPDGTCESSDFVGATGSAGDWTGIAGGSFGQTGKYFVAGNHLYVVGPDRSYFAYRCDEPGVLQDEKMRFIR